MYTGRPGLKVLLLEAGRMLNPPKDFMTQLSPDAGGLGNAVLHEFPGCR